MSIEKNIERIADALEALVHKLDHIGQAVNQAEADSIVEQVQTAPKQPVTPPPVESVAGGTSTPVTTAPGAAVPPSPPAEPVTPAPTTPPPVSTPAATAQVTPPPAVMTPEDLNKALVAEFQRLGSREPIDAVMRAAPFNAQSITDLSVEQYAPLIAAVKAVAKV